MKRAKTRTQRKSLKMTRQLGTLEKLEDRLFLANWYVAPGPPDTDPNTPDENPHIVEYGDSANPGTIDAPWDIESALTGHNGDVQPGDTIWLRGGTYYHPNREIAATGYVFNLQGTPAEPIAVRPYLQERATIDGGLTSYTRTGGRCLGAPAGRVPC